MEIEKLIPTMTKEQIAEVRRGVTAEVLKPTEDKKSFGEILRDIVNERGIDMEDVLTATGITDLYGLGIDFKKIAIRLLAVYCGFRDICPCIKQGHSFYP